MNEKETSEEMIEKLKYYHEHKDEIERKKRIEDYLKEQTRVGKYFEKNYKAGRILAENGYQIFDLNQANQDFRKVLKLDEITEIAGIYDTIKRGKRVPNIVPITKSNFYNAFYQPIWENLTLQERLKSIEWMFESICQSKNINIKCVSYFPSEISYLNANGYFNNKDFTLFFNVNDVMKPKYSAFDIVSTMAHELMHARQAKYVKDLDYDNKYLDFYTLSQTELGHFDISILGLELGLNKIDYATRFALYRVCRSEKTAELEALKTMRKYQKLNEAKFGKNKSVNMSLAQYTKRMLFGSKKTYKDKKDGKTHFYATDGLLANERKVLNGQHENLLKIIMLMNLYSIEIANLDLTDSKQELEKVYSKQELEELMKNAEEETKLAEEKIALCKAAFLDTLELGKLPEYFTEKEFEPLQIIDEPKSEWSLPKWLRCEEMKYNNLQERAKNLL